MFFKVFKIQKFDIQKSKINNFVNCQKSLSEKMKV